MWPVATQHWKTSPVEVSSWFFSLTPNFLPYKPRVTNLTIINLSLIQAVCARRLVLPEDLRSKSRRQQESVIILFFPMKTPFATKNSFSNGSPSARKIFVGKCYYFVADYLYWRRTILSPTGHLWRGKFPFAKSYYRWRNKIFVAMWLSETTYKCEN